MWIDDNILRSHREQHKVDVFVPDSTLVVLGSSNDIAKEVNESACSERGIPVTRRYGGGGTVVLYPGCVVVSIGTWVKEPFNNGLYFKILNDALIRSLALQWPIFSKLSQAGISDVVFGEKKVAGTSLFRSRQYLLFQASVLVTLDRPLIASVLTHPTKEPDYRLGRSHETFLTCLQEVEPTIESPEVVASCLNEAFLSSYIELAGEHVASPITEQMRSLEERLARAEHLPKAT